MSETSSPTPASDAIPTFEEACAAVCGPGTMFEITAAEIDGVENNVFAMAPPNISVLFSLAAARTDEFVVYEDERWTMPDILGLANRMGHALVETYGVEVGDRVALAMRNFPEWIAAFAAITSVGGVAVPLNAWWQTDELAFALDDSSPKVVFADRERLDRLSPVELPEGTSIIAVRTEGDLPERARPLDEVLPADAAMPVVEVGPDDDVTILYTSGTTGRPKGAVSTHRAVVHSLMMFAARAQVADMMAPPEERTDPENPPPIAFMLCVPLFHVTGLVPVMLGSFLTGARLIMTHRWDPSRALELIEREGVSNFVGVPTMAWDLLESPDFESRDTSSLRSVGGGGAPMPPELVKRIDDNFATGRPGLGYGMTETNAYGPQNAGDEFVNNPTSTGRVLPLMELKITDPEGNTLATGETGEIWFKAPCLIKGYWNRPDATAETIVDGWLRSGDIGRIDAEGFVYVSDRAKDMVLRGGENIYCSEVEAAIYEHPAVYEAAVYGVPHDRLGEELACHVMVKEGQRLDVADLQRFLAEKLAVFKVPSIVTVVDSSLPRNASGKILKRELRDETAAAQGAGT